MGRRRCCGEPFRYTSELWNVVPHLDPGHWSNYHRWFDHCHCGPSLGGSRLEMLVMMSGLSQTLLGGRLRWSKGNYGSSELGDEKVGGMML